MRKRVCLLPLAATAIALAWALPFPVLGHADLLEQISIVDGKITAQPDNTVLYLKRAELHRQHGDHEATLADLATVRRLAPDLVATNYIEGRVRLAEGEALAAIGLFDRYLAARPDDANALVLRARARKAVEQNAAAAEDYDRAIGAMDRPLPDIFLERANHIRDTLPGASDRLLRGLDQGVKRLGPSAPFLALAIDVETHRGQPLAALSWFERLPEKVKALPKWQARRGELLNLAGNMPEAKIVYRNALDAIEGLPAAKRNRPPMKVLETKIRLAISEN